MSVVSGQTDTEAIYWEVVGEGVYDLPCKFDK